MVQCDFSLQKKQSKIFLEKKLLWLCPKAHRTMPKIQGNKKEQQGIQVSCHTFFLMLSF